MARNHRCNGEVSLAEILDNDDFFDDYLGRGRYNGHYDHHHHEVQKDRYVRIIELEEHFEDEDDFDDDRRYCRR